MLLSEEETVNLHAAQEELVFSTYRYQRCICAVRNSFSFPRYFLFYLYLAGYMSHITEEDEDHHDPNMQRHTQCDDGCNLYMRKFY